MDNPYNARYARKVRGAWIYGGNSTDRLLWGKHLSNVDPREFMLPKERRKFDKLPDEFTVYRGFQPGFRDGHSWTLSREVAEKFTDLNEKFAKGEVIERHVRKSEVFALIDNDEQEVIIIPGFVPTQ